MSKHILIIEDEPYLAEMYKLKLEHVGYKVSLADNGNDGVAAATREMPDLILLDLVMPGLDGYQVLKELKAHELTKRLRILILSNLNQDEEVRKCLEAGAEGFLVKANLTPGQISDHINGLFGIGKNPPAGMLSAQKPSGEEASVTKRGELLLIEDQEDIMDIFKMRLEKAGFAVAIAQNGAWGLKLAQSKTYKAIIMDILMPAMNGLKMLEQLRADSKNKATPIIVLSNSAQDGDIEIAKQHGATAFLLKAKITPAKLAAEVEKLV